MAAVTRQPFAPLDGARLQTLTSLKNRQNALTSSPGKRKASEFVDTDDSENVDPSLSAKRSKGTNNCLSPSLDAFVKPSTILITKSASSSDVSVAPSLSKASSTPRPRSLLNPKSPASKHGSSITKSTPLSAPAGRSPTRGKRSGILSRRRTATSYSRVDPPTFGLSSSSPAPFSLDAALKGTIPSYASRSNKASSSSSRKVSSSSSSSSKSVDFSSLHEPEMKSSWFFDIHEDTPEQEMTNLLQHSTCVLDISSDEESETRRQRERAEGKENVPPADDVSQTTSRPRARRADVDVDADAMVVEKERRPLGEMDVKEYYSEGCDENSVVIVPGDDHEEEDQPSSSATTTKIVDLGLKPVEEEEAEAEVDDAESDKTAEQLMRKTEDPAPCAAVLEPLEGTGESFEVWESGSAKDEAEGECC
ncbi:hypothetical protein F4809DRAFT_397201 [Biscogniauxia mediterranea]|nr:hypothetical protein F4809DRAFT_397201 [Biscogniauxia mediterranea]